MKIELWYIGKSKFTFIDEGVNLFIKRINAFRHIQIREFPNIKSRKNKTPDIIKAEESNLILNQLDKGDFLVALDENGKTYSSIEFARLIQQKMNLGTRKIVFVVGGAYGLHDNLKSRANLMLSLSKMTFSHQVVKLIFMEQLYRAFSIINNHPYHNE